MLNCCQLMMALEVLCFTTRPLPCPAPMVAVPAATTPPLGSTGLPAAARMGVKAPMPIPMCAPRFKSVATVAFRVLGDSVRYDMGIPLSSVYAEKIWERFCEYGEETDD